MLDHWTDESPPSVWGDRRSYDDYLRAPQWRNKIRDVTLRMFGVCYVCGMSRGKAAALGGHLDTAHITYPMAPFTERIDAENLTASDVVLLCARHHRDFDVIVDDGSYGSREELHMAAVELLHSMRRSAREQQGYYDAD
jgi:hypothetical protein